MEGDGLWAPNGRDRSPVSSDKSYEENENGANCKSNKH